ncbi:DUF7857 domain-containing protein [Halobaculum gomorrense]|nr:hypothetical protein [Halobaculum gomorrense]
MPITLDSTVATVDGVAFVAVRVRNTEPVDRAVRLENRLDGRVLPPRRHGAPEPGWSSDGYVGVVGADSTLALGYACRAGPDGLIEDDADPVSLADVADPAAADADPINDVLADLPDHRPPPDAASVAAVPGAPGDCPWERSAGSTGSTGVEGAAAELLPSAPTDIPPAVAGYLDEVDARLAKAEAVTDGSVAEATELLEAGTDPDELTELIALDAAALERLASRVDSLASRAEAVDVPTDALERLA